MRSPLAATPLPRDLNRVLVIVDKHMRFRYVPDDRVTGDIQEKQVKLGSSVYILYNSRVAN